MLVLVVLASRIKLKRVGYLGGRVSHLRLVLLEGARLALARVRSQVAAGWLVRLVSEHGRRAVGGRQVTGRVAGWSSELLLLLLVEVRMMHGAWLGAG